MHSGRLLLRFEGVRDRTAAEALRNILLIAEVDPEELPEDPEEFYDHQLMDLDVVLADGTEIGRITEITPPALAGPVHRGAAGRQRGDDPLRRGDRRRDRPGGAARRHHPAARPDRRERGGGRLHARRGRSGEGGPGTTPTRAKRRRATRDAARRRHDLPRVPGTAERLAGRQGARPRPSRRTRPRPAGLDVRPAQHGRRHPVRRRPRHGHEDRALGRGPGRGARRRLRGRGALPGARRAHAQRQALHPGTGRRALRAARGWSSPPPGTRASTAG